MEATSSTATVELGAWKAPSSNPNPGSELTVHLGLYQVKSLPEQDEDEAKREARTAPHETTSKGK